MANKLFPESWAHTPACEYCDSVRDGTHDTPKPLDEGYPLVTSKFLRNGKVHVEEAYYISKEDFDAINARSKVELWDVLMSMIGTIGELAIVREEPEYAIKNIALFKCGNPLKAEWLYYVLSSPQGRALLKSAERGTTQKFISLQQLRLMKIPVPPPSTMAAITEILSTIDAKIEHNNELIEMLEEQAQLVYDYWFMQFDFPDENGRPYRSSGGKMVWSNEINREIPPGWKVYCIQDIVSSYHKGITPAYCEDSPVMVINQKCVRGGRVQFIEARYHDQATNKPGIEAKRLQNFDTLVNSTGVGSLGRVGWFIYDDDKDVVTDSHVLCLRANPARCLPAILYMAVNRCEEYLMSASSGSTGQAELDKEVLLKNIKIALPSPEKQREVNDLICSLRIRAAQLATENIQLAAQRDFLLPQLMSGQAKVAD